MSRAKIVAKYTAYAVLLWIALATVIAFIAPFVALGRGF